ncbi:MAG: sel1 repeat family protein [Burkholderiaceae bacterium]|jgi:TPR repeat protein|nr:sel1 repeat family protein [Burkholderiaceae bacterium]
MYGEHGNDKSARSSGGSFAVMRHFFMLLTAGLLSFLSLTMFGRAITSGKLRFLKCPTDERMAQIKEEAIVGDPQKQLRLGVMCALGVDGWIDHRGAVFWFVKAAEQGEPNAQMLAAMMYLEGLGVRRDYRQAARWARLSALHGNPVARMLMGVLLEDGAGVRRDPERAMEWYRHAASYPVEIGARQRLGSLYLEGKGVQQDTETGMRWIAEAAEKGDANAAFQLGMIYYDGRLVQQDYAEALRWYLQAASVDAPQKGKGANEAVFGPVAIPGEVYTKTVGQIMKRNQHVVRDACFYVGLMYETGRGVEQDMGQSRDWYQKAADAGDEIAAQRLVYMRDMV